MSNIYRKKIIFEYSSSKWFIKLANHLIVRKRKFLYTRSSRKYIIKKKEDWIKHYRYDI